MSPMNYCVIKSCPPNLTVLVRVCSTSGGVLVGLPLSGETLNPLRPSEFPHGAICSFARKLLVKVMDNVIVFNYYSNLATPRESAGNYFRVACSSMSSLNYCVFRVKEDRDVWKKLSPEPRLME